ncbi:MAG: hypothetical protein ACXADH_05530 [Candidatus Kariarchaeaceae archaeon]|jgi:hypothetical protein
MKDARLIFTEDCNRNCPKCCNNGYNFDDYPGWKWSYINNIETLCISGGEPMLYPFQLLAFINRYKALQSVCYKPTTLYVYTAYIKDVEMVMKVINKVDGIVVTLHDQYSVGMFELLNNSLEMFGPYDKSLRLNIFNHNVQLPKRPFPLWNVMRDRQWMDECPLPEDKMYVLRNNFER